MRSQHRTESHGARARSQRRRHPMVASAAQRQLSGECDGGAVVHGWPRERSELGVSVPARPSQRDKRVRRRMRRVRTCRASLLSPLLELPRQLAAAAVRGAHEPSSDESAEAEAEGTRASTGEARRSQRATRTPAPLPCWALDGALRSEKKKTPPKSRRQSTEEEAR